MNDMASGYCHTCKQNQEILSSTMDETGKTVDKFSCGHELFYIKVKDSVKAVERFELKKKSDDKDLVEITKKGDRPLNANYSLNLIKYADLDLLAAQILFRVQDQEYDFMNQAAFLCAQSTEKYLKGFLFHHALDHFSGLSDQEIQFKFKSKYKHKLKLILKECSLINPYFNNFRKQINILDKYSLLKYPDIEDKLVYSANGLSISSEIYHEVKLIGDFIKRECGY